MTRARRKLLSKVTGDNIWRPPMLAVFHPSLFTALEINEYERQILANPKATERDASEFFSRFPKFLFLGQGRDIRREVVLLDSTGRRSFRVDFFRKSFGNTYWDIIELKHPQENLIINSSRGGHPRLSAPVSAAISQAEDYRELIIEDAGLRAELMDKGIAVYRPQILVVIGKNNSAVSTETIQILHDRIRRGPIEVRSYDDLYQFAKEHYEANKIIVFLGQIGSSRTELATDLFQPTVLTESILFLDSDGDVSSLGELLTSVANELEKHSNRRERFRNILNGAIYSIPKSVQVDTDLITIADKFDWPIWAVECLPRLCSYQASNSAGKRTAVVWRYLFNSLPPNANAALIEERCKGQVVTITFDEAATNLVNRMVTVFENERTNHPFPSERSIVGAITNSLISLELEMPTLGENFRDARGRILSDFGIIG